MKTSDFDYVLPPELIAQEPLSDRSSARMMVIRRTDGSIEHSQVSEIGRFLEPKDLLVVNDTKVISARVFGRKSESGGKAEVLFLEEESPGCWLGLLHTRGRLRPGIALSLADDRIRAEVTGVTADGRVRLNVECSEPLLDILEQEGAPPLPPYIKRPGGTTSADRDRYQTVYADNPGAVAAPTAGLHFTPELMQELAERGIDRAMVTLHVGVGTFRPVKVENLDDHIMDSERYTVTDTAASQINAAREGDGRVVSVGTTSVRVLETVADEQGIMTAGSGRADLFIRPGYRFKAVDSLMTNFHLPKSTLIMLVSAFAGRELVMKAYQTAVEEQYRFYSYGDCMLIT